MKIVSNQDIVIKSSNPNFKYKFEKGKPIEVSEEHSNKILLNNSFKKIKNKK